MSYNKEKYNTDSVYRKKIQDAKREANKKYKEKSKKTLKHTQKNIIKNLYMFDM